MKIMHLASYYMKGLGYQENCLPKYQKQVLNGDNDDVVFYTSERSFPFADFDKTYGKLLGARVGSAGTEFESDVKIIRRKPFFESVSRCFCLFSPLDLYRVIKREEVDVIHLHGATNINAIFLVLIGFFINIKIFIDCHGDAGNSKITSKLNRFYYFFFKAFYRLFDRRIECFLPVAKSCQEYLYDCLGVPEHRCQLTPLCFDHEYMFFDGGLEIAKRESLGKGSNTTFLGYFGKLSPEKNVLESLDIFARAKQRLPQENLHFLVVGEGDEQYKSELVEFIAANALKDCVTFLPMQDREGLRGYLSLCKAAFWIGSPSNCIQEAMGCKTVPFLTLSTVTERLIIDDRQNISAKDCALASEKVCAVIQDADIDSRIESYALENYTWRSSALDHIKIYEG